MEDVNGCGRCEDCPGCEGYLCGGYIATCQEDKNGCARCILPECYSCSHRGLFGIPIIECKRGEVCKDDEDECGRCVKGSEGPTF